jgi:hypothetical protein
MEKEEVEEGIKMHKVKHPIVEVSRNQLNQFTLRTQHRGKHNWYNW